MNVLNKLRQYQSYLKNPDKEALIKSISNCHAKGIFSLVINGTENGKLTRVFVATEDLNHGDVQYHTHRYNLLLTPLTKSIIHYVAEVGDRIISNNYINEYSYRSFLLGGNGLNFLRSTKATFHNYALVPGTIVDIDHMEFHTMSCKKGDAWIVEEKGFRADMSFVLGTPFISEGLYTAPLQYQINDMCQLVLQRLNQLILSFEGVNND